MNIHISLSKYPASIVEKRPKFHFLFPHIAVLTGIAWDHINVFPTFDNYLEQFRIFIGKIENGGFLIYNQTDEVLQNLVRETHRTDLNYLPYGIPEHRIHNGITEVVIEGHTTKLRVFGNHNLLNLHAAWLVCRQLNLSVGEFARCISDFTGAAKRLEVLATGSDTVVYRDFAHAPSKVKATIEAVKTQFPGKKIYGILELHTYSSLNEAFMKEYEGVMNAADEGVVFYSKHALELKRMPDLPEEVVQKGFHKDDLKVFNEKSALDQWLQKNNYKDSVVVLMSSGNYDGLDMERFAKRITQSAS